ncbi:Replication factor C subunit 1 [Pseudolycoriella hygida]|uniref:Replication factor C subunit 1 n=1 Tax=Pseudolycoriella hygida TaxID=35572 RepID=A0A9Q0RUN5_9DIPT|nr:Replication factor C subunit 1 [Pseudolycoriella hygida]
MSRDIRSFFTVNAKKSSTVTEPPKQQQKKKAVIISSDEDEDQSPKKNKKSTNIPSSSNKRRIVYSDDEDNTPSKKKPNLSKSVKVEDRKDQPKLKLVEDVTDVFGDKPIKRFEKPVLSKTMTEKEINDHFMDDFDISAVADFDVGSVESKTNEVAKEVKDEDQMDVSVIEGTPNVSKSKKQSDKRKSAKNPSLDSSVLSDEDRQERKRHAAILYQQFKNRSGPLHHGSKEVPEGKPNCLNGLVFVLTGVFDSLERDEAADIIKKYGGKVTTSLSKNTSYIVVGEEAGLAKLAKADQLHTKRLTEDDLLNLIRTKSGLPSRENHSKNTPSERKDSPRKQLDSKSQTRDSPKKVKEENKPKEIPKKVKEDDKTLQKNVPSSEMPKESSSKIKVDNKNQKKEQSGAESTKAILNKSVKFEKSEDISFDRKLSEHEQNIASVDNQAWVDKYKPTNVKQIIGQQGAGSNVAKLQNWLNKWYSNHDGKKKLQKPNPWAKNDDGSYYKAALLSGPPGVGKTTTATLVCLELGFDTVEFNASDTRSKRLLKEEVSELLSNKSLAGYFHGSNVGTTKKHVLLMDEVDGMGGNEDRGGMQELISLIKESSIPIICMCNDRNHPKIRSLVNYCYDLRFSRPRLEQIRGAMLSICFKEQFKMPSSAIDEIISATNNDIRQTINHLTLMSANNSIALTQTKQDTAKKDMKLGPWDVVRKVFSAEEHKTMSLADKSDLFFNDYSMGPLFVQQNYLIVAPKVPKAKVPEHVALAANSLSLGDLVENRIRSKNAWSMLPLQAMYSSVLPGEYMAGSFIGQINFPGWLGKNSKSNKRKRLAQEIHDHTRIRTSGSRLSIRMDYAPYLIEKITKPLRDRGVDGVEEALSVLKEYRLLREDIDSLIELTSWPGKKNPMDAIEGRVKAALTRAYNKEVTPYTYTASAAIKKKRSEKSTDEFDDEYGIGDEVTGVDASDEEENESLESDVLIKAKKKPVSTKRSDAPSTSKKTGNSSRKAKK